MRAFPATSVVGSDQPASACQFTVAPVLAPLSLTSARGDALLAPAALFQFAFATTPAVSLAAIAVPVPTKSMLTTAALVVVPPLLTARVAVAVWLSEPLVPVTVNV